ncbi:MAG: RnfABCDGE type electron transport complex subunit B [Firmicutes bacterium]|jgi:electron transport complex protein RnfB|nr:RnfABCDGE type electron transport complex subunit B [Bacillota bacterium]
MLTFAIVVMALMGVVFGILLGVAGKKFHVEVDPRVAKVRDCLPGANCGGCGYPGCDGFAEAVVAGKAPPNGCKPGGPSTAAKIADVLGVAVAAAGEREVARVMCAGGGTCGDRATYKGIPSCRAAVLAGGGFKSCEFGCLGLGDCRRACQFGAISMSGGMPVVAEDKCVACGNCVKACPRGLIALLPESKGIQVACRSTAPGAATRKVCKVGCIGCRACVKACQSGAITVENNLARIDPVKCTLCGACVEKCPTRAINDVRRALEERQAG